jgi:hypothetical protein
MRSRLGVTLIAGLVLAGVGGTAWAQGGGGGTDIGLSEREWPLISLNVNQIHQLGAHGANVVVAVVDSGVNPNQPDLAGSLVPGADFSKNQPLDSPGSDTNDIDTQDGHGTGMSSIIAAHGHVEDGTDGQPTAGVIGLADEAKIMPVRVGTGIGESDMDSNIANGIRWATLHGARVINLSLAGPGTSFAEEQAIQQAIDDNVVVVAAAGNDGQKGDPLENPADVPGVVAVSGVDSSGNFWPDSEHADYVAIAAPSKAIVAAGYGASYIIADGTSGGTAYVSAEAALIIGLHPNWTAGQVIRVMLSTATPGPGQKAGTRTEYFGYGIMNPVKALQAAAPSQTSDPLLAAPTDQPMSAPPTQDAGSGGLPDPDTPVNASGSAGNSSSTGLVVGGAAGVAAVLAVIAGLIAASSARRRRLAAAGAADYGTPYGVGVGYPGNLDSYRYQGPYRGPYQNHYQSPFDAHPPEPLAAQEPGAGYGPPSPGAAQPQPQAPSPAPNPPPVPGYQYPNQGANPWQNQVPQPSAGYPGAGQPDLQQGNQPPAGPPPWPAAPPNTVPPNTVPPNPGPPQGNEPPPGPRLYPPGRS